MKPLSIKETSIFCEQLGMILESGISQSEGISAIANEIADPEFKATLNSIVDKLNQNVYLSEALKESEIFDDYVINMIKVGEKSGYMDRVMNQLAIYYQRLEETKDKLKDAITYPSILMFMMLVVIGILLIQVLPIFHTVLNNLGTELSSFALALMHFGDALTRYGIFIILIVILFGVIIVLKINKNKKHHSLVSNLSLFVLTKKLAIDLSTAQFSFVLSLLINSGYNIEEALEFIPNMVHNEVVLKKIKVLQDLILSGKGFDNALIESNIFKSIYNRMIVIGVKTGKLEETLSKVSNEYENEVNSSINRFLNIVEPTLVAISSIIVGIILLSVMLPLMSVMSSLG